MLRSGTVATEYFDKYRFEADPAFLRKIAEAMVDLIPPDTDALAGLELGGVAIAVALSQVSSLPTVFVRKKAKEYGTCLLAEGMEIAGKRLVIVEDVVTSGGQVMASAADLRVLGAHVDPALCVIDRQSGGTEAQPTPGSNLRSMFTTDQLAAPKK